MKMLVEIATLRTKPCPPLSVSKTSVSIEVTALILAIGENVAQPSSEVTQALRAS